MKRLTAATYLSIFSVLILLCLVATSCRGPITGEYAANKDVLNFRDFSLNTDSVGLTTTVNGTIFVKGNSQKTDSRQMQISARVEIDPRDWGGVGFYVPDGWKVSSIHSDYPQGDRQPERYTTILKFRERAEIFIGNSQLSADRGGGEGSVVIELEPLSSKTDLAGSAEIVIAAGSSGKIVQGPVSKKIVVPLNLDYRTPVRPVSQSDVKADYLVRRIKGQTGQIAQNTPEFTQISREAVKIIEAVDGQLTEWPRQEEIERLKQTENYLEVEFRPPLETITSRIRGGDWEAVELDTAIFFFSGKYYGMVAWPAEGRTDQYEIYSGKRKTNDLETLVRSYRD
jgi:hypothetical protein